MALFLIGVLLPVARLALSFPLVGPLVTPTSPAQPLATACGDIIVAKEQGYRIFWADEVFDCLQNVPFNDAVATRFISYYNQTLQFQSTLGFLKDPPEGYQQPPVDVLDELQRIQDNISKGVYRSQYLFEADLQLLINRIHDAHVYLDAGALAAFTFASPYGLVSASSDGKELPSIYLHEDIVFGHLEGWQPSPITEINGVNAADYLTTFAEINSEGYVEPHADWNAVMSSPARDIQGRLSVLQSANLYPGEQLNFTFANGSNLYSYWLAVYNEPEPTGPLTTAGDFYNFFVLGLLPAVDPSTKWWPDEELSSDNTTDDASNDTAPDYGCSRGDPTPLNWCSASFGAYPNDPTVAQQNLGIAGGGVVSGYLLDDISTGVLSIPSFMQLGNDTANFFSSVDEFIGKATSQNISRIVIDLQQNAGGLELLAISTFKRFFYGLDPFTGSRIRSHELANILGTAHSAWWDGLENRGEGAANPLYQYYASSEWVATNRINARTGANFSSWSEYYGPISDRGDAFSLIQRYNLSDETFSSAGFQGWIPYGYGRGQDPNAKPQVWAPEDIVLLTDDLCSSACVTFVELFHQAGAKTVVVGGRPTTGPMQSASGSRGARLYSSEALDFDFANVNDVLEDKEAASRLPSRTDAGMWTNFAGFNIRDQMRKDDTTPLQFKYEAAHCRIFYTINNVHNMSQLWRDAAAATWDDPSLCVQDSTGYSSGQNTTEIKKPPPREVQAPKLNLTQVEEVDVAVNGSTDLLAGGELRIFTSADVRPCPVPRGGCGGTLQCQPVPVICPDRLTFRPREACVPSCSTERRCPGTLRCRYTNPAEVKRQVPRATRGRVLPPVWQTVTIWEGFCEPTDAGVNPALFSIATCPI